jgi:hypothetical protein
MGKSPWNWWRRHRKHQPLKRKDALKGKSFLLQQIEHGDLDHSDYLRQAREELVFAERDKKALATTWIAGPDSLRYKQDEIDRKYIKRHNKLMEDYNRDESSMLFMLKDSLLKEFGKDCWDEVLEHVGDGDLKDFYYTYKNIANGKN